MIIYMDRYTKPLRMAFKRREDNITRLDKKGDEYFMENILDKVKHLLGKEITVRYNENGEEKEKIDVIKDIIRNDDGTYNIIFVGEVNRA